MIECAICEHDREVHLDEYGACRVADCWCDEFRHTAEDLAELEARRW